MKKLGFGLMRLPYADNPSNGNVDMETTKKMIDAYMDAGNEKAGENSASRFFIPRQCRCS